MSARPFRPLWVTLPGCEPRRIDSAFDALECLITAWPSVSFRSHRRAVRACRDALDGFVPAEKARRMLLEAAIDVDLPVTSKPFGNRPFTSGATRIRPLRRSHPTGYGPKPDKEATAPPQPQQTS